MEQYYADLVWLINGYLFVLAGLLSVAIIITVVVKQIIEKNRYKNLAAIVSGLRNLSVADNKSIINGCVTLIKESTTSEFFEVAKHMEAILPDKFLKQINDCICSSGKAAEIENIAIKSKNKWRRIEAIILLGYLKAPAALSILKKAVADRDEDVAYFSILSLGNIKTPESANILLKAIKSSPFGGYKIASILEHFPREIMDTLIKKIDDPDAGIRLWAIRIISRFRPKEYIKKISGLALDDSTDIRAAACDCLAEIPEEESKATVIKLLHDPVWFVRMHAARALEKIMGPRCMSHVADLIKEDNPFLKEAVKNIMAKHIESALPYIEKFLNHEDQGIKNACLEALQLSGYLNKILEGCVSGEKEARDKALGFLKSIVESGGHFGLESSLRQHPQDLQRKMLDSIAAIDKNKAEHIEKRIKGYNVDE